VSSGLPLISWVSTKIPLAEKSFVCSTVTIFLQNPTSTPVIPVTEVNLERVLRALEDEVMGGSSLEGVAVA